MLLLSYLSLKSCFVHEVWGEGGTDTRSQCLFSYLSVTAISSSSTLSISTSLPILTNLPTLSSPSFQHNRGHGALESSVGPTMVTSHRAGWPRILWIYLIIFMLRKEIDFGDLVDYKFQHFIISSFQSRTLI